jgi:hypothetical protein
VQAMRFSERARGRMRRYGVDEAEVRRAVAEGKVLPAGGSGLRHAWLPRGQGWLRVFFVSEPKRVRILTLSLERQGPPAEAAAEGPAEPDTPAGEEAPAADGTGAGPARA